MVLSVKRIRLPKSSSSSAARALSSVRKLRRSSPGVSPGEGGRDHPGHPARGEDGGDLGLDLLPGLAGPSAGEAGLDLGELAVRLGEGLVEAPGLLVVQAV